MTVVFTSFITLQNYFSVNNLRLSRDYVFHIQQEHVTPLILLHNIMDDYSTNIVEIANSTQRDNTSWEQAKTEIRNSRENIKNNWQLYKKSGNNDIPKNLILAANTKFTKADLVLDHLDDIVVRKNKEELNQIINSELPLAVNSINESLRVLIKKQQEQIQKIVNESNQLYQTTLKRTIYFALFVILSSITLALFIIGTITKSLKNANNCIKRIAEGDLTLKIEDNGNDEIGQLLSSLKLLIKNLKSIIEVINSAANNIAITSSELSSSSQQVSQGTTEQAASVEQMAASMEEISANIIQNAKNAQVTEQISTQAGNEFEKGRQNIETTFDAIKTIASKISIIDEIAFQTNILALNAAVEAARAGEQGKGFGVVASEVGNLAERSKLAAADIETLSRSGVELSLKSKELLRIALPSIRKTINLVKEISLASSEQSSGIDQINSGIQTLNQVTQQNAASSEEMATVAQQMAAQAEQLSNSIGFFNIGIAKKEIKTKVPATRYITSKPNPTNELKEKSKGIEIDMDSQDDLDNEFETF